MLLKSILLLAAAALAQANKVTFINQDDIPRTVVFTPSRPHPEIERLDVGPYQNLSQDFPLGWEGNWYAFPQGEKDEPGMLGEVKFDGFEGLTFFDVSGIVKPHDHHNVKKMYPAHALEPDSGCNVFWCNNTYWLPDDVQTKATLEHHLITTLGDRPEDRDEYAAMAAKRSIGQKFRKANPDQQE